jgi:TIR domain
MIFISYRRDDDPAAAARVLDGLAKRLGKANLFMDVDNLLAGRRFDEELAKALTSCDVFIAILGARWMELLKAKRAARERDYVQEEIAGALRRKIIVIPVRVGREGHLLPLPLPEDLPTAISDLVLYQKHDITHENFARDVSLLADNIATVRRQLYPASKWLLTPAH